MLDAVADQAARPLFVRCLVANHNRIPGAFNPRSVAAQLRAQSIVPALWAPLVGYAFHTKFEDFYRHFVLAAPNRSVMEEGKLEAEGTAKREAATASRRIPANPADDAGAPKVTDDERFASMSKAVQQRLGPGESPDGELQTKPLASGGKG